MRAELWVCYEVGPQGPGGRGVSGLPKVPPSGKGGRQGHTQRLHLRYVLSSSAPTTRRGRVCWGAGGHKPKEQKELEKGEAEAPAAGPAPEPGPRDGRERPTL